MIVLFVVRTIQQKYHFYSNRYKKDFEVSGTSGKIIAYLSSPGGWNCMDGFVFLSDAQHLFRACSQ